MQIDYGGGGDDKERFMNPNEAVADPRLCSLSSVNRTLHRQSSQPK